jgi:hypothetical protein
LNVSEVIEKSRLTSPPSPEDCFVIQEELVGETGVQKEEAHADARLITDKEEPACQWLRQLSSLLGRA